MGNPSYFGVPLMKISDDHKELARALAVAVAPAEPEFFQDVLAMHLRSYLSTMDVPTPVNSIEYDMLRVEAARLKEWMRNAKR